MRHSSSTQKKYDKHYKKVLNNARIYKTCTLISIMRNKKSITLHSSLFKGCSPSIVIFTFINIFTLVESLEHTAQSR